MVALAHAVVDPVAMVIEFVDALIACVAVSRIHRVVGFTVRA
jgi:hypothetical protein